MVFHWDGHRIVRNYKGSKRPEGIDSELWKMLGPHERKQIIEEEDAKAKAKAQEEKPAPSFGSKGKKKKASTARLEVTLGKLFQPFPKSSPCQQCQRLLCLPWKNTGQSFVSL